MDKDPRLETVETTTEPGLALSQGQPQTPRFDEQRDVRAAIGKGLNKQSASQELLEMVDMLDGIIPKKFYRIFLFARYLDRFIGKYKLKDLLCPEAKDKKDAGKDDPRNAVGSVEGGYTVHTQRRVARTISDLALASPFELATKDITTLLMELENDTLEVDDLELDGQSGQTEDEFAGIPNDTEGETLKETEQCIYILIDLSYSMREDQRLLFAQTLTIWYLNTKYNKQGKRPRLFVRGFANKVGQLTTAENIKDVPLVIDEILDVEAYEKGTDQTLAFVTACNDIKYHLPGGRKVDILMLTDTIGILDPETVIENKPPNTNIHVVKIGADTIHPAHTELEKIMREDLHPSIANEANATERFYKNLDEAWRKISQNLIELPDIEETGADNEMANEIEQYLETNVFTTDYKSSEIQTRRHATFISDLLTHILEKDSKKMPKLLRERFIALKHKLAQWLIGGVEIEIEGRFAKAGKEPLLRTPRPGKQKVPLSLHLRRGKSGVGIQVNKLQIIWKILVAALRKIRIIK